MCLSPAMAEPGSTAAHSRASSCSWPGRHCVKVASGLAAVCPPRSGGLHSDKDSGRSNCPLSSRFRFTVLVTCTRQCQVWTWGGGGSSSWTVTFLVSIKLMDRCRVGL